MQSLLIGVHHKTEEVPIPSTRSAAESKAGRASASAGDSKAGAELVPSSGSSSNKPRFRYVEGHQEIYFIGIIDFLSRYGTKKKGSAAVV